MSDLKNTFAAKVEAIRKLGFPVIEDRDNFRSWLKYKDIALVLADTKANPYKKILYSVMRGGHMSSKRFRKIIMAIGAGRNEATELIWFLQQTQAEYEEMCSLEGKSPYTNYIREDFFNIMQELFTNTKAFDDYNDGVTVAIRYREYLNWLADVITNHPNQNVNSIMDDIICRVKNGNTTTTNEEIFYLYIVWLRGGIIDENF